MKPRLLLMLLTAWGLSGAAWAQEVKTPDLNGEAKLGKGIFEKYCAQCHGPMLTGTDQGPPLLHPYYRPGHHGDGAFYLAVRNGVRQHHWRFGNMKPVAGLTDANVSLIVKYVRAMQQANGVY